MLALFLSGILTGCQTAPSVPEWKGQAIDGEVVTCTWPALEAHPDGALVRDVAGLKDCRDIAEANEKALRAALKLVESLNEQGERYVEYADTRLQMSEEDRRKANLEAWTYKGVLALVLIAVAL